MAEQEFTTEELESEEWRDVDDYERFYSVSNLGRVYSRHGRGKVLKAAPAGHGYLSLRLCKNGAQSHFYIHDLVARAFIGPKPEGYEVNHKDTQIQNNRDSNLEYLTRAENLEHARLNGKIAGGDNHWSRRRSELSCRGERHGRAKITDDDVREIRNSSEIARVLGARFGLSVSMIGRIKLGKGWKHVH